MICESDPPPPSVAAARNREAQGVGARAIQGDLDKIVLLAMRKEPERRYASVAQFAADVDAYLAGYPVLAAGSDWRYRAGKFLRRHKAGAAAAAAVAVALLGFSSAMAALATRARRQQTISEQQAQFLSGIFGAATPEVALGKTITARELLDRAAERIDRQPMQDGEVQASLLGDIASAYRSIGLSAEAQPLAERGYELSSRFREAESSATADALELAAQINRDRGQFPESESRFLRLVALRRRASGPKSLLLARALTGYGETLYNHEKFKEAEAPLREALAIDRRAVPDQGSETRNFLALALERQARYPDAAQLLQEAAGISRQVYGPESPMHATSLHNLGSDLIDLGDMPGAEQTLREVLAIRRRILPPGHPDLLMTLNNLGFVLLEKGDGRGAEPLLREMLDSGVPRLGPQHFAIATYRANWARALEAEGNFEDAEREFRTAIAIAEHQDPAGRPVAGITYFLAELAFDRADYAGSERLARKALDMRHRLFGDRNPVVAGLAHRGGRGPAVSGRRATIGRPAPGSARYRTGQFQPGTQSDPFHRGSSGRGTDCRRPASRGGTLAAGSRNRGARLAIPAVAVANQRGRERAGRLPRFPRATARSLSLEERQRRRSPHSSAARVSR